MTRNGKAKILRAVISLVLVLTGACFLILDIRLLAIPLILLGLLHLMALHVQSTGRHWGWLFVILPLPIIGDMILYHFEKQRDKKE